MRYEGLKKILVLAIRLQAARGGITIDEIRRELSVSRRTAERLRDAVESAFGPLETVPGGDSKLHWRLQSDSLRRLVRIEAEEFATLATATEALEQSGLNELAKGLEEIDSKLRAMQRKESLERIDSDLETLMQAEGLATRPGPRQPIDPTLLSLLREAILSSCMVEFSYVTRYADV